MKKFTNITQKELSAKGVRALSDRPNASSQYGVGGLSPAQLKQWFDNLAVFLAGKINDIYEGLSGKEAADYIRIALDEYNVTTLGELMAAITSGDFAKNALQVVPTVNYFGTVPLQKWIFDVTELINEHFSDGYYDSLLQLEVAPPLAVIDSAVLLASPTLAQIAATQNGKE